MKIIHIILATALLAGGSTIANAQNAERGQNNQRGQEQRQNMQQADCDGERLQLRDGSGMGKRAGVRQFNGQRRGPQDGSGKNAGGGLRNGTGPRAEAGTCPNQG